ncbi:MAG: hypothetical protein U0414_09280 [Polyangiaceae bacterium]
MSDELSFFIDDAGAITGPRSDDAIRAELRELTLDPDVRVRLASSRVWAPARAWATLAVARTSGVPLPRPAATEAGLAGGSPDLLSAPSSVLDMLLYVIAESGKVNGPVTGEQIRRAVDGGRHKNALVAVWGTDEWIAARRLFDRTLPDGHPAVSTASDPGLPIVHPSGAAGRVRCPTCLEIVSARTSSPGRGSAVCPECDEPLDPASVGARSSSGVRSGSVPDEPADASWLRLHWRPLLTVGGIMGLIMGGITLRYLAPGRLQSVERPAEKVAAAPAPQCEDKCWPGEACQEGECVWQKPKQIGHVPAAPSVAGPFELPRDFSDGLIIDQDRFAIALLSGIELRSTKTGQHLELVSEALQTVRLARVGDSIYGVGPAHLSVLDAATMHVDKMIDMGAFVGDVTLAPGGHRAFISLPGAHAISIFSTEFNAEIDRIRFGDDNVGAVCVDDAGTHALASTGVLPLPGLAETQGGAVYAFDPSRLGSAQDRIRASMLGNPVAVLSMPSGEKSFALLRARNAIAELEWLPSGAVRQSAKLDTCDQPEQIELARRSRTAVVRCNRGRSLEVFTLDKLRMIRQIPLSRPVTDMVLSPDGEQAIVTLSGETDGAIGLVDLKTYDAELIPVNAPLSRVRISPSGDAILVVSDRVKAAWVIR